jgi:hypothetical protein
MLENIVELQVNFSGPFSEFAEHRKHAAQCHSHENLHKELDQFLHERAFDLYFQSPWVSGSPILEIMETSFYHFAIP